MAANPRAAAVAALVRQEQDGFSNLILDAELRRRDLDGRDKAFASAIFYTVLEHRGTIDFIFGAVSAQRPCQIGRPGAGDLAGSSGAGTLYAGACLGGCQ